MREIDVLRALVARMHNYEITSIVHVRGRLYEVVMKGQEYRALVVASSFEYYERRYHVALSRPSLVICHTHESVLPVRVLALRESENHEPYSLPVGRRLNIEGERRNARGRRVMSKLDTQVLLGMLLSGMRHGFEIIEAPTFPESTRNRYLARLEELGKRRRGRPVGTLPSPKKGTTHGRLAT